MTSRMCNNNNDKNNHKWMEVTMATAMKEAAIQQYTNQDIADIVRSFERDIQESDRALEETLRFAESLLLGTTHQHDPGRQENDDDHCSCCLIEEEDKNYEYSDCKTTGGMSALTEDDKFDDNVTTITLVHSSCAHDDPHSMDTPEHQLPMAYVPPLLAMNIAKFCDCPIIINSKSDDSSLLSSSSCCTAQVPVACLLEALQVLLDERDEFIGQALELMQSSRRTATLALTSMEIDHILSSNELLYKSGVQI